MILETTPKCSFYESAFNTREMVIITLPEYITRIQGGTYKGPVLEIRRLHSINKTREADYRKRKLPLFVPGGVFREGRKAVNLSDYSACVCADLDDVPGDPADWLRKSQALAYVKAGHVSPSGTGLKLFIMVDTTPEAHEAAFRMVKSRLEQDLPGIVVDPSGKDVCRGCFVSFDPDAFYKQTSEALSLSGTDPLPAEAVVSKPSVSYEPPSPREGEAQRLGHYLDRMEQSEPFVSGNRHTFVLKAAAACNRAGFSLAAARSVMLLRYPCHDFTEKEVEDTLRSGYQVSAGQSGVNDRKNGAHGARRAHTGNSCDDTPEDDGEGLPEEVDLALFPDSVYATLPQLLTRSLAFQPRGRRRDMLLISQLAVMSTCLPGLFSYVYGRKIHPHLFTFIEGASGSGKGVVSAVRELAERYAAHLYVESERREQESLKALEEYECLKAERRKLKPAARQPLPPKPVREYTQRLFIPCTVSCSKLISHLSVNGPLGGLMFAEEAETLVDASEQRYGNLMPPLRHIAMQEEVGNSYKTDDTYMRVRRPAMAMVLTGTLKQFISLLPSAEDGMMGRMLFYHNDSHPDWIPLTERTESAAEENLLRSLGDEVLRYALYLRQHPFQMHLTQGQREKANRLLSERMMQARCFARPEMEGIVRRGTIMLYRVAMVFTGIRYAERELTAKEVNCEDCDFQSASDIVFTTLDHSEFLLDFLPEATTGVKRNIRPQHRQLIRALPDKFTRVEAHAIGSAMQIDKRRVNEALSRSKEVYIRMVEKDSFVKIAQPAEG